MTDLSDQIDALLVKAPPIKLDVPHPTESVWLELRLVPEEAALAVLLYNNAAELAAALREREKLRGALEFYADEEMWLPHKEAHSPVYMDDGKVARAALGGQT